MENKIEFVLEGKELEKAEKWIKKQKKKYGDNVGTIGDRFSYRFIPTGLGCIVCVCDALTGKEKSVSDTSNW